MGLPRQCLRRTTSSNVVCMDFVSKDGEKPGPSLKDRASASSSSSSSSSAQDPSPSSGQEGPQITYNDVCVGNSTQNLEDQKAELNQNVNLLSSEVDKATNPCETEIRTMKATQKEREEETEEEVELSNAQDNDMVKEGLGKMNCLINKNSKRIRELEQEPEEIAIKKVKMRKSSSNDDDPPSTSTFLKCFESNCYMEFGNITLRNAHTEAAHAYKMLTNGRIECCFNVEECNRTFRGTRSFWKHYWEEHLTPSVGVEEGE